jgi:hypothetical protein
MTACKPDDLILGLPERLVQSIVDISAIANGYCENGASTLVCARLPARPIGREVVKITLTTGNLPPFQRKRGSALFI